MKANTIVSILLEDEEFDAREYLLNPPKTPGYATLKKGLTVGSHDYYEHSDGSKVYMAYTEGMLMATLSYNSDTGPEDRSAVGKALLKAAIKRYPRVNFGMFMRTTTVVRRDATRKVLVDTLGNDELGSMSNLVAELEGESTLDVRDQTEHVIYTHWD